MHGGDSDRIAGELRLTEDRTVLAHASAGGGDGRFDWYAGLGTESSDGWPLSSGFEETAFEDGGTRVNSDFRRSSAMGRVGFSVGEAGTLHASVRWIDAEKGIPFHTTEPAGFVKFSRFSEWNQSTFAVGYEHEWTHGDLRGQLYGHAFENTLDVFADPDFESLRLVSSFSDRVYGGYVIGGWNLGQRHRIGTALHLRQDRHRKIERYPDGSQDPSESYQAWTWSASAEDRWRIGKRTSVIGSLALEGLDVHRATSLREIDDEPSLVADPLPTETLLSPQIEVQQTLSSQWWLSGAVYRRARFPTMRQLYGTEPPNPHLAPQHTTGVDLGAVWSASSALTVRGTVFFNRVAELITRQSRDDPFENQDEAEIKGVELRLQGASGVFEYGVSWTGLDHRFTRSSEGFNEIPFVPDHQIEVTGVAHLGGHIDLRGVLLATGKRVAYDRGDRVELGGYAVLGLGLTGRVGVVELSLQVDNALDVDFETEPGYPLEGRRIWLGCRFVVQL